MITIGVAGHVDHGKTSMVRALTGMETDRLAEEQRRGISIELGFAWLDVAVPGSGVQRVALIDMPGHEKFVRRMIAGAMGIDAVLLVVAADEGAMPQGREHLAICTLLGVQRGAVVLTKIDLVDGELQQMAADDVRALVQGSFLDGAPVWPFSARQPRTTEALRDGLAQLAGAVMAARSRQATAEVRPFLLPVDRAFSVAGRGTVVTGTALCGRVDVDQNLQVLPAGGQFRVRGLHTQGTAASHFAAPGRLAVNLAAATVGDVAVGSLLAAPGSVAIGRRALATLTTLTHATELKKEIRATVHIGTAATGARVRQLGGERQPPGTTRLVEIFADQLLPLPPRAGFVLRGSQADGQHGRTLAGGAVLLPWPRRLRGKDAAGIECVARFAAADLPGQLLAVAELAGERGVPENQLGHFLATSPAAIAKLVKDAVAAGKLRRAGSQGLLLPTAALAALESRALAAVDRFHRDHPHKAGIDGEALQRALGAWVDAAAVQAVVAALAKRGAVVQEGPCVARAGFKPKAAVDGDLVQRVVAALAAADLQPPLFADLAVQLGTAIKPLQQAAQAGAQAGALQRLGEDHYVATERAHTAADRVIAAFGQGEAFSTGDLKDLLGLTRKHLIPFAEWLDEQKVTVRDPAGNRRVRARALADFQQRRAAVAN